MVSVLSGVCLPFRNSAPSLRYRAIVPGETPLRGTGDGVARRIGLADTERLCGEAPLLDGLRLFFLQSRRAFDSTLRPRCGLGFREPLGDRSRSLDTAFFFFGTGLAECARI